MISKKQATSEFVNEVYLENESSKKNLYDCKLLAPDAKIDFNPAPIKSTFTKLTEALLFYQIFSNWLFTLFLF